MIDRSRMEGEVGPESEKVAAAEKKRAQNDAAVTRAEAPPPSLISRVIGTGDDARTAGMILVLVIIVLAFAYLVVSTNDGAIRSSLVDLLGKAMLLGLGFLAGHSISRRK